jgi:hypothetical protein
VTHAIYSRGDIIGKERTNLSTHPSPEFPHCTMAYYPFNCYADPAYPDDRCYIGVFFLTWVWMILPFLVDKALDTKWRGSRWMQVSRIMFNPPPPVRFLQHDDFRVS